MKKKDFHITIEGVHYVIRNVPYEEHDCEGEVFYNLGVCIKIEIIFSLMYDNVIPKDVNFDLVADEDFDSNFEF